MSLPVEKRKVTYERLEYYYLPTDYRQKQSGEYAALALQGNMLSAKDEIVTDRRILPWNGDSPRYRKEINTWVR